MTQSDAADRLSSAELAQAAAVEEAFIEELKGYSILEPRDGGHAPTDIYRVRFASLVTEAGISLDALARAMTAGVVGFGDLEMLFPDPVRAIGLTHRELATELGIDGQLLGDARIAAGLAARGPEDLVPEDETRVLRSIFTLAGAFDDPGLATRIARNYGESTRHIAASSLAIYDEYVTRPLVESGATLDPAMTDRSSEQARVLMDLAHRLLTDLYQHHWETAALANWAQVTEALLERHGFVATRPKAAAGIAFVDLAGFTRLTDEEGDEVGTILAGRLAAQAERVAAANGCRIVKLLGDGVMLHGSDPAALTHAALDLVRTLPSHGLPPAHAGVHAGPLVERDGDFFGSTVNIAARIAAEAAPGEVLVSEGVAGMVSDGLRLSQLSPRELRGVRQPVTLFRLAR